MNKSYHCLRIGLKRKRQDSENKRIREFNVNKINCFCGSTLLYGYIFLNLFLSLTLHN